MNEVDSLWFYLKIYFLFFFHMWECVQGTKIMWNQWTNVMYADRFIIWDWIAENIADYESCHYHITFKALKIRKGAYKERDLAVHKYFIFVRIAVKFMTMEYAGNKGLYALIKCLGFGLVFNQLPEQFIAWHTQATWILSFNLTSTD